MRVANNLSLVVQLKAAFQSKIVLLHRDGNIIKSRGSRIQNGDEESKTRVCEKRERFLPRLAEYVYVVCLTFMAELENCLYYSHRLFRFLVVLVELLLELSSAAPGGGGGGGGSMPS